MALNSNTLITVTRRDADGTTWHVFEDKGCKITVKFNLDEFGSEPQPDPLHEEIKHAAEEAVKIKTIRDRLGVSVSYLEGLLNIGDVVKDVSRSFQTRPPSDHKYSRRYTRSLVFPEDYCLVR